MSTSPVFVGAHELRRSWGWFLLLGFFLIIAGCAALSFSFVATLAAVMYFGFFLLVSGVMEAASILFVRRWQGYFLHLLMGILDIILGIIMVRQPLWAAVALTFVIATFFLIGGIYRLVTAITMQFPHWGFAALSGLVSVLLGLMLYTEYPVSGLWFIGTCIGIDLVFRGASWVTLALRLRRVHTVAAA
jgi:uncharacterized membrane protein HdeD (DUF308 family)